MPRRPSKKSKAHPPHKPRRVDPRESTLRRWERAEDVPMDGEDQFHAARDRILLDGEGGASDEEGEEEEEVFALEGMPEDASSDEDDDDAAPADDSASEDDLPSKPSKPTKSKSKPKTAPPPPDSDEAGSGSESEEEGWGTKKSAYYASNEALLEEEEDDDDDEARALEEREARRLQARAREPLREADFGLADVDAAAGAGEPPALDPDAAGEEMVPAQVPQDRRAALLHLQKTSPETLALARDWDDVAHDLARTQAKLAQLEAEEPDALGLGMVHLYYQTLLTYATTLAFYLHLAAQPAHAARPQLLRAHPVLARLLTLKQAVGTLEDLNFGADSDGASHSDSGLEGLSDRGSLSGEGESGEESSDEELRMWRPEARPPLTWRYEDLQEMDPDEVEELLREAHAYRTTPVPIDDRKSKSKSKAKSKDKAKADLKTKSKAGTPLPPEAKPIKAPASEREPPKKKRKTAPTVVFDLVEPDFTPSTSKSPGKPPAAEAPITDVYGDAAVLQRADAADKASRQKSLRFITQRIESTSARRKAARAATGGDDDIPYRERRKEREARNKREVAKTRGEGGADLDGTEPEPREEGRKRAREESDGEGAGEGEDGYYELVAKKSKRDKAKKKEEYDAVRLAERVELDEGTDGPRAPTKAILNNRGLTPHRSKSVRNPRVKKRQRYEKAKKKLSSQKATYKGGLNETGGKYVGEKSGISKVIKSVRL